MRRGNCPGMMNRRHWLAAATGTAIAAPLQGAAEWTNPKAPTAPVALARCADYGARLTPTMETMFNQLGGLGKLVRNKTVGIKVNFTGGTRSRLGIVPAEHAQYTHPAVIGAMVHLLGKAGAHRIRILEGAYACADPLEEFVLDIGWDPAPLLTAATRVEMENTNLANGRKYARFMVPAGLKSNVFKGFDLNHSYADCDVLVNISKLKEHATAGVTLCIKNMFGATPISIYGDAAGKDEPNEDPKGGRGAVMHSGKRQPSASAIPENDPSSPRNDKYRIPRIIADLAAACPTHINVIDGIYTMAGGEGPWLPRTRAIRPGLLLAGLNAVTTDAIGTAVMGFDPMEDRGTAPFEYCDSTLRLAEELGVGTRDPKRIEVVGLPVREAVFDFRSSKPFQSWA